MKISNEQDIIQLIKSDAWMMRILENVKSLGLPDACVCAGFIRSKIWDVQHDFQKRTPIPDIDVIYFDKNELTEEIEKYYERKLRNIDSSIPWSVKNEARMHVVNNLPPYLSSIDAISKFPETATALGVTLDEQNNLLLIAPHGVEDLLNLVIKPTPYFEHSEEQLKIFEERIVKKNWVATWHKVTIVK